jgi:hypothetical protein
MFFPYEMPTRIGEMFTEGTLGNYLFCPSHGALGSNPLG